MARLKFPGRPGQRFGRVSVKYKHDHHKLQPESTFCVADNINVRLKVFNDIFGDSDEDEDFGGFSYWDIKKAQNICNQVKEEKSDEAPRRGKRTVVRRSYAHMIRHGFSPSEVKSVNRNSDIKKEKTEENSDSTSSNDNNNSNNEKFPIGKLKIRIDRGGKKARIISNSSSNSSIDENIKNDENVDIPQTGNGKNVMKKVEKMVAHRLLNRAKQSKEKKLDNEMKKKDIDKSSECIDEKKKEPEVEEIAKSPHFTTSSPRRKAFVLPARSARSSRLIIPRKRLMEEFDCTTLKYQVSRKPIDDINRSDAGKVNKKSDLVSINSDKQRPSLKMKMKISSLIPEKSNLTTETRDCEGNLTKRIEQDISKYADTMARKKGGKIRNKSANSPVFSSNSTGVDATSSGVAAKFSEEECDGVTARIEKMLRSQWDGRLRKPNGKRSSDEEIAASKQRASTQRRTKNILRKARLQLNKRTLMKLRQPASVRKLSEQFLKDQSEVHTSVKLNRFPTVSLEPMDAFLKQTKSLSCVVCNQTNNFCLVNEHFGQMCCEYCLKFYMGSMTEEFVCENKVNVGNCVMKPNVLGQLINCKHCWLQKCLKKFKINDKENLTNSTDAIKNEVEENTPSLPLPKANGVDEVETSMSKAATTVLRRSRGRPKVKMAEAEQTEIKTEQISPPNERGPRIKHVCRRASVVLGFQRATFPSSSTRGMAHKALKKAKRIKAGVSRVQKRKEKEPALNPDQEQEEEEEEEEEEIKAEVDENDTEDQDYTELKQQKIRRKSTFGTKRKVRCKKCTNCTRKDCGKCTFCVDMRKFGGRQVLKQCCMHRKCLNPLYKGTSKSTNKNLKIRGSNQNSDGGDSHSSPPKRTGKELEGSQRVVLSSSSKKAGLPTCGVSAGEMMDGDDELWPLAITGCDAKKRKANFAHNVFVPRPVKQKEKEDYDPDEIWNFGRALISAHPFPIRIVCFLCGSGGQYEMIYCILCCEAFHRFCLEAEDVPLPENVENWCCRKCQSCNFCGTKNNLLKCFKCQNTYHAQCLGPNYPSKPSKKKKIWMCTRCVKCKSCGATSPGTSSGAQWMFDFSLCYDCGRLTEKGNYCPLCQKCYEDDDYDSKMVQCMECKSWIHAKCDDMTDEMYQIISYLPESVVYTCRKCTPERPPTWLVAVEAELKAGLILVLSAVTSAKCAKHLVHGKVKDKSKLDYSSSASSSTTSSPVKSAETTLTACEDNCPESDSEKKNILLPQLQDDNLSDLMDVDLTDYLQLPSTELFTDVSLDKNSSCEISDFNLDTTQNLFGKNLVPDFDFNMGFSSGESSLEKSQKELIIEENVRNCISLIDSDVMATLDQQLEKENNNGAQCDEIICDSSQVASIVENEEKKKNFQNESGLEWREFDGFFKKSKNNHRKNKRIIYFDFKEGQPQDLQTVQENVKKAHYTTVRLFCEDVIRVIRSGGVNGKKGNTRAIKTIFVKQMEKIFPWFAVTSPSLWGQFDTRHRLLPEAVVPPNSDHNYAQYLDTEPDEFDQPSLFTVSSPHSVMDEFGDCRWCILCSDVGDGEPDEVGRLLYCGQDDWIHLNCAVWSAEVFQEVDGSLQNVHAAITRGRVMKCELCNFSGATVGCCLSGCRANYHFMCARKANAIFQEDKKVYCSAHRNKANDKILTKEFTVSHSVYVDLESLFPKWAKKTWQKGLHPSCISILAGAMMIEQLGTLSALSDTPEALIPINFQCTRVYWSTTNPRRRVVYTLKTIEVRPETVEETEVIEHVTTVHEQEEKLESSEKVGNTETSKDSEKTEKFKESCAAETNEDKDTDKDNPEKEDLINRQNRQNMDKTTLNEKIENEITESTPENENTKDENTICINSAKVDEKTMSQIKSEVVDLLRDILEKIDLEVKKELIDEVKNELIKEENVEEVKEKITSNGHLKKNICAESVVLLTPLCKKKLAGLKLSDSCQRAIGKKIRKNWGLEPLKKYPVRSTRYRAELVEPVINGRKIKVKEVKCEEERATPRVRHLSGRRCLKTQDSPQNGLILKPKRYNFRSKERSMVSSKENQFANAKVELDICEKQKCDDEQDGDVDEMSCKNESTKGSDTECVVVANHRNATASLMQVQKSCSVKLKRIPSILRVRKVTINGLDGADETLGLEDPPIRNEVVTVEGKNGTSCCITRARGGNLERMKKMCALNQDDNHNIVEAVEVADKKDEEPDCQQSNGFCSNENSVENHLQHSQNHVESNESTDINHQTSSELNFKPNNAESNKDTGPFKCNKCKCLYRTMESCKRHMATCNFEVETTSSEDESLSPKSTGSQSSTGKRKLTSDEESGCKKRRKLFEDDEENVNNDIKEEIIDPPVEKEIVEPPLENETLQSPLVKETQIEPFTPPTPNPARIVTQRRLLLPKPQEQQPEVKQQQDETAFTQVYQVPMGTPVVFSVNDMNTVTPLETVMEPLHVTYVGSVNVNQGQLACLPSVMSMPSYTVLDNNLLQPCIAQNSWDNSSPLQLHIVNQAVTSTPIVNHQQHVIPQFTPTVTYVNNHQQQHPQQNVVQVANEQLASLLSRAIVESTSKKTVPITSTPVRKAKPVLQTYSRKLQNIAPKTEASGSKCTVTSSTVSSGSCDVDSSPLLAFYQQQERLKMVANSVGPQQQQLQPHIVYQISSEDGFFVQTNNVNEAWRTVAERVQDARAAAKLKYVPVDGVNGINMSGLGQNAVQYILEQMPQAKTCQKYRFRFHEQEIVEEIPENPTGCARSEPFHTRKEYDMFNFLASKHRRPPDGRNGPEEEEMQHKSSRRATSMDLPMAMRFRHLRQTAREAVGVYRSKIHGRGLFCKRCIDVGEMVIEYAGEVIRSVLTDMREKYYESKGIGCYMFRIDDNEVVDATMHGNAARFINHSCEPNCYSKVITVDGKKHIIIFALRRINRGEELTYDYKFPIEDIKIPCTCGSRRCRKYLN